MKHIITKPFIRAAIIATLTICVGLITSLLGNWDKTQPYFPLKVTSLSFIGVLYICFAGYYATIDVNQRRSNEVLQGQVDTFENLVISLISIFESTATDVNECIHLINKGHTINLNIWNYEKACKVICRQIYNNICTLSKSNMK